MEFLGGFGIAILLFLAIGMVITRLREKMPRCPRCSLGPLKWAEDLWTMHNPWSYYECDKCGAKLKILSRGLFLPEKVEDCDIEEWEQWEQILRRTPKPK
jgi:hypothetical protein